MTGKDEFPVSGVYQSEWRKATTPEAQAADVAATIVALRTRLGLPV